MMKKYELSNSESCLNKARVDEPIFVLRAKDPRAAQAIRHWAAMSEGDQPSDKINEALSAANEFDDWRSSNSPPTVVKDCGASAPTPLNRGRY